MTEKEYTWSEAIPFIESLRKETKTVRFPLGKGVLVFRIRLLTQEDRDSLEALSLTLMARNRDRKLDPDDVARVKFETIQRGVVSGPPEWTSTKENVALLPSYIRDELSKAIEKYETLDEETEAAFRGPGTGTGVQLTG